MRDLNAKQLNSFREKSDKMGRSYRKDAKIGEIQKHHGQRSRGRQQLGREEGGGRREEGGGRREEGGGRREEGGGRREEGGGRREEGDETNIRWRDGYRVLWTERFGSIRTASHACTTGNKENTPG